jgi:transcriptional regulator with XRE-family HTH domain
MNRSDEREITREYIVATRQSFGRSAEEVARDAGISLDEYLGWEAGEFNIGDPEVLARIESAAEGKRS